MPVNKSLLVTLLSLFILLITTTTGFAQTYEDAEDGTVSGWSVYDKSPAGANINNVDDADRGSKVIELQGSGTKNGYILGSWENRPGAWNDSQNNQIRWSMKYSEAFTVFIRVTTNNGPRYIYYTASDTNRGLNSNGTYIHYGLGAGARNGAWQTFTRDLQADLKNFEPANELLAVQAFLIRGSGRVDDIELLNGLEIPDTTAPQLTLNGDAQLDVSVGDNYIDAGANAVDYVDGPVTVSVEGSVDTSKSGFYVLTYTATDQAGNSSSTSRTVRVLSADGSMLYEDAEDGNTLGWRVYDKTPAGAIISNVDDAEKSSKVIELQGDSTRNGYILGNWENRSGAWNDSQNNQIRWSMKYSEAFTVFIRVTTTNGPRYIYYTASDMDKGLHSNGTYIHYGLGSDARDGTWRTFTRDLEADLKNFEPGNDLLAVQAFLIRGSGRVDDIELLSGLTIPDTTAPVLTLNGESQIDLSVGDNYVDAGANAVDYVDGPVTVSVEGSVDTSKSGFYVISYTATDQMGNSTNVSRTVRVLSADGSMLYEDAEDGNTLGWRVYDKTPVGATISNVVDADRESRVIQLQGDATRNGYILGNWENRSGAWNDTQNKNIRWSMKYSEAYTVFVRVTTTTGPRYLYYTASDTDRGIRGASGRYIHHGLGVNSKDGLWHTYTRDLEADLKEFEPDNTVLAVQAFLIRGSGRVDDIQLLSSIENVPPTADAGEDITVRRGEVVTLTGVGTDTDGTIASYRWTGSGIDSNIEYATTASFDFDTSNKIVGDIYLTLTVTDNDGATAIDDVKITILPALTEPAQMTFPFGNPLTIEAGTYASSQDFYNWLKANIVVYDYAGNVHNDAAYQYDFEGYFEVSEESFDPNVVGNAFIDIQYTNQFGDGLVDDRLDVIVTPQQNVAPVANAGADKDIVLGETVTLDGSASNDPDGNIVEYQWLDADGALLATGISYSYAPDSVGTHTLTLKVKDNQDKTSTDTVDVNVALPAPYHIVFATNPYYVDEDVDPGTFFYEELAFNASVIDADNNPVDGTPTFTNQASVDLTTPGEYALEYTFTDEFERLVTATLTVVVRDITAPVITLLGDSPMTVVQGSEFVDPGVTVQDNVDRISSRDVVIGGDTVDTSADAGTTFVVTYNVNDSAGNAAMQVTREIQIVAAPVSAAYTCPATEQTEANFADSFVSESVDDLPWPSNMDGVALTTADIESVFNTARALDSTIVSGKQLKLPAQNIWDGYTSSQKALYLLNSERCARGIRPFEGISPEVETSPAQYYADYLATNDVFGHSEDGETPWERLTSKAGVQVDVNADFFQYAENLAYRGRGAGNNYPILYESVSKAVYAWIYADKADTNGSYGHRKFALATGLVENSGEANKEGLIGVGLATSQYVDQNSIKWTKDYTVLNAFDPAESWDISNTITVDMAKPDACLPGYSESTIINDDGSTSLSCQSMDASIHVSGDIYKVVTRPDGGSQPVRNDQEVEIVILIERNDGTIDPEPVSGDYFTGNYTLDVSSMDTGGFGSVRSLIVAAFPIDMPFEYTLENSIGSVGVDLIDGQNTYDLPRLYLNEDNLQEQ